MGRLISEKSIEENLRRTASKGYISLLNEEQLESLSLKYFGITNELGNIVGYMCPYSGEILTSFKDIVLEHIIPVNSKGGTVLFNCIPTSSKVNGRNEKWSKHLISWWKASKYWDDSAPKRLEKLVNYILEAYEKVFEEYSVSEVESSYLTIDLLDDEDFEDEDNLEIDEREESQKQKEQAKDNGIQSYLGFILDCIKALEQCEIDTNEIRNKLKELEDNHIFDDIERYEIFQSVVQDVIKSTLGDDNKKYLTYSLGFNIKKLMDSITCSGKLDIYQEIKTRLTDIEMLLKQNNISLLDYYENLMDLDEINILYNSDINNIPEKEINEFIETIKIGHETKIMIFIEMLNEGNAEILKAINGEYFKGYDIPVGMFWHSRNNRVKIIQKLKENANNSSYDKARELIRNYEFANDINLRIAVFIEMLNEGNDKILNNRNGEYFKGYDIPVGSFWHNHNNRAKIIQKLFKEMANDSKYATARDTFLSYFGVSSIEEYIKQLQEKQSFQDSLSEEEQEFANDLNKRIEVFIEMLNEGNYAILNQNNTVGFKGYEKFIIGSFWNSSKDKIKQKLKERANDPQYDKARELIRNFEFENDINKRIEVFIEMLNEGTDEVLNRDSDVKFKGYKIQVGSFWHNNKDQIIQKLFKGLANDSRYATARDTVLSHFGVSSIEEYEFSTNISLKIAVFIEMLNEGNAEILKFDNGEYFKGYENILVGAFWQSNKDKIIQKLKESENDSSYDIARQTVLSYFNVSTIEEYEKQLQEQKSFKDSLSEDEQEFANDINKRIEVFIEMLNEGETKILKQNNDKRFKGYEKFKVGKFWRENKDKIIQKLKELGNDPKYETARELIRNYEFDNNPPLKIAVFIEMLNEGNAEILKADNGEYFNGYDIPVRKFWNDYKDRIIQKLFKEMANESRYDKARDTVLTYFEVSSIEEYEFKTNLSLRISVFIEMLNEGTTEVLNKNSGIKFKGYNIPVGQFWNTNKDRIIQKLFKEMANESRYDKARDTVLTYFEVSSIEEYEFKTNFSLRISVFIEMLNEGNDKILKAGNGEYFKGYDIPVGQFWHNHNNRTKIIQKLKELENDPGYDKARQTVLLYFKVSSFEELEIKQKKGKTLKNLKQIKTDLENVSQSYVNDDQHQNSNSENIIQFYPKEEQQSVRRA